MGLQLHGRGVSCSPHATFRIPLVRSSGRAAAPGLKPLGLPRAPDDNASVLPPTLVRSLPIECALSRSMSFFSALVCDVLPRRLFHGSPKAHCQKSISVTILTSTAWRTVGLFGAVPTPVGGHH